MIFIIIGIDFKNLKNTTADFNSFINKYSLDEIKIFFSTFSGFNLGIHTKGYDKPSTSEGIPDIRRIYGAGLKVLSNSIFKVSDNVKFYADIIIKNVIKYGFTTYSKAEALLSYICLVY